MFLEFSETPNYDKLKHYLLTFLLSHNVTPDNRFDWSKFKQKPNTNEEIKEQNEHDPLQDENLQLTDENALIHLREKGVPGI